MRTRPYCMPPRLRVAAVLACLALAVCDAAVAVGVSPPIFVCADAILLGVTAAEGLATENPGVYP